MTFNLEVRPSAAATDAVPYIIHDTADIADIADIVIVTIVKNIQGILIIPRNILCRIFNILRVLCILRIRLVHIIVADICVGIIAFRIRILVFRVGILVFGAGIRVLMGAVVPLTSGGE